MKILSWPKIQHSPSLEPYNFLGWYVIYAQVFSASRRFLKRRTKRRRRGASSHSPSESEIVLAKMGECKGRHTHTHPALMLLMLMGGVIELRLYLMGQPPCVPYSDADCDGKNVYHLRCSFRKLIPFGFALRKPIKASKSLARSMTTILRF